MLANAACKLTIAVVGVTGLALHPMPPKTVSAALAAMRYLSSTSLFKVMKPNTRTLSALMCEIKTSIASLYATWSALVIASASSSNSERERF